MSIMRCEEHDRNWDSDKLEECPLCENKPTLAEAMDDLEITAMRIKKQRDDLAYAARRIRDAFTYNPGHSDLDNEQPITITVTLGDWRKLNYVLNMASL